MVNMVYMMYICIPYDLSIRLQGDSDYIHAVVISKEFTNLALLNSAISDKLMR